MNNIIIVDLKENCLKFLYYGKLIVRENLVWYFFFGIEEICY